MPHLRFALVQKLHSGDEDDSQSSKQDENLVAILVLGGVVCREEYHCWKLVGLIWLIMKINHTWNPKDPGVGYDI
jgi:hypothetical protein